MTPKTVSRDRLIAWLAALDAYGFVFSPPITAGGLALLGDGVIAFRAMRKAVRADGAEACTLTVAEVWLAGDEPGFDRRLDSGGCHLTSASWHLQVGNGGVAEHAERLDVVPDTDSEHPRIHRHPLGSPNHVREPAELPPPLSWLNSTVALIERFLTAAKADVEDEVDNGDARS